MCYGLGHGSFGWLGVAGERPTRPADYGRPVGPEPRSVRLRQRAASLIRFVRDVATLMVGRRADGRRRSIRLVSADLRAYLDGRRAARTGRAGAAVELAEGLLVAHPNLIWALETVGTAGAQRGAVTRALDATRRLRQIDDRPSLARRERSLRGQLEETEPGWLPLIAGDARPVAPRSPDVVMHLLKSAQPDRQSGYTIRSLETMRAQAAVGLEPFAVTPYGYPPARPGGPRPDVEVVGGITHHHLSPGAPTVDLASTEILSRTAALAAEVARLERPALIHAASGHRGYELALVGLALRSHLRLPLVYEVRGFLETVWGTDEVVAETAERTRRRFATEARVMAGADAITTLGRSMRDELVSRGVPDERIVIVPNGIDPAVFAPCPPDPALQRRYGLEDRWVFGYVSGMDHRREQQELLIEAAGRLVRAGRPVSCLLVGDGSRRPELEAMAAAAGLGGTVVFTGHVAHDAIPAHYALFDAFVVPRAPDRAARFVTPLKPFEAMAMRRPVVVSDLPALVEIVAPDERGLAFATGDAASLVAVLERLMDHPELADRIASAGLDWVLAERTWARNGPRYRELYETVIERFAAEPISAGERPAG